MTDRDIVFSKDMVHSTKVQHKKADKRREYRVKVIETSILFDSFGDIWDTQSRVLEVDNWEDYIKEIKGESSCNKRS